MIEVHHLRYVLAAAELGSFSRAADAIGVKQSTLSKRIRDLEIGLGVALFARSTRGACPTVAGRRFVTTARQIIDDLDDMRREARALGRGSAGRVSIGFGMSLSAGNLRATIRDFAARYPEVELFLVEAGSDELLHKLERRVLDIAVVPGSRRHPALCTRTYWSERLLAAMSGDCELAARDRLVWADLSEVRVLLTVDDHAREVRNAIVAHLGADASPPIDTQHVSRDNLLQLLKGRTITIVGESSCDAIPARVTLREIHDAQGAARIGYSIVWHGQNDNPALRRLLELVADRHAMPVSPS